MSRWLVVLLAGVALAVLPVAAAASIEVQIEPDQPRRGDAARVNVTGVKGAEPLEAQLGKRTFPLTKQTGTSWTGFVGIDRDTKPGEQELTVLEKGKPIAAVKLTVAERTFPEQHLEVSESQVTLSEADLARAVEERKEIVAALGIRTTDQLWASAFRTPVEGRISSQFGLQRYYNGKKKSYHSGLDIAAPRGTKVAASSDGRVALTGDFFYTGLTVFVDHGGGLITAYFHMEALDVAQGDFVTVGESVGRVGSTGRSTGAHLHWGAYVSGVKVDPGSLVTLTATEQKTAQGQRAPDGKSSGKTP